jgi:predicted O-linked N-acetylglucosamine transferase (SPINDLY family)
MSGPERNDPCPCGSGKKYKHCCLGKTAPLRSTAAVTQLLQSALQHHHAGRLGEAGRLYREALAREPEQPQALHRLGILALQQGQYAVARDLLRRALGIYVRKSVPQMRQDQAEAYNNLGVAYLQLEEPAQAAQCLQSALELRPDYAEAYHNLGTALLNLERCGEAVRCLRKALALKPDYVEAWYNLGTAYGKQGMQEAAIASFRQALRFDPRHAGAHHNLGLAYLKSDKHDEAGACFKQALILRPENFDALASLSNILLYQGGPAQAIEALDQALALNPDDDIARSNRLLILNYLPSVTSDALYLEHKGFGERFETPLIPLWRQHDNTRDPERRLKIGYVSPDLRLHSVAFFMEPVLEHHDRRGVEVYCYYNNTVQDEVAGRLQSHCDHWVPCLDMSDDALAARIRADGIDILVDLAGHTGANRLLVFARKPAPVQVSYLGYPATTGLKAMDWRLVTAETDPPGTERWHTERLYRLPRSLWCYRPPEHVPEVSPVTAARENGYITFGSMNNIAKVSDTTLAAWVELLQRLPRSRLLMTNLPEGEAKARTLQRFAARGIGAERLCLLGKLSLSDYYKQLNAIDIALDPWPYNGTTTTCQSLWMGVPVVTWCGETSVARSGYALLKAIGLSELVAQDAEEYVAIAAALAGDLDRLEGLRRSMRAWLESSPLRDEAGLTRDLEAAYRAMWMDWCNGGAV